MSKYSKINIIKNRKPRGGRKNEKNKGFFVKDENFITVYGDDNCIYTIARGTGDWGFRRVGDHTVVGHLITQEDFDRLKSSCEEVGEFSLDDGEEDE